MNKKTLKIVFIILAMVLVLLFLYFGFGYSDSQGIVSATFVLNDKAKIAAGLLLLSYPVYRFMKWKVKP